MQLRLRRRVNQLIVALYAVALLASVAMVIGPFINDMKIGADPQRALGTITGVDWMRTAVEYQDADGIYYQPSSGLLYPTGLVPGQQVWVNYAADNPELVKVEGREWTLSIIPALSVTVVSTLITGGAWWMVNYRRREKPVEATEYANSDKTTRRN